MTPSLKAQIENDAKNKYPESKTPAGVAFFNDRADDKRQGYIAGATPYAEKLEASEQENKRLREGLKYLKDVFAQRCSGDMIPMTEAQQKWVYDLIMKYADQH